MYEKLEQCPSCKATKFQNHSIIKDHSISRESFAIVKCEKCNLLLTNPRPSASEIWKYYESNKYISHSNQTTSLRDLLYKLVRNYTLKQKVSLIKSFYKQPSLLDYGCGTGHFLQACIKSGINAEGIEPTKSSTISEDSKLSSIIYEDLTQLPKHRTFDIITAWHVLEHVHELQSTVKSLSKLLSKTGYMIVALPNHQSHDGENYKEDWAGYDVPRHLYHFSPKSFKVFADRMKLEIVKTIPMKFDAYYVSMLSEQYKGNKSNLISGMIQGYKSNKEAKKTNQYSSLIYILRK